MELAAWTHPRLKQLRFARLLCLDTVVFEQRCVYIPSAEAHVDRWDLAVLDPPEIHPHLRFREHILKQVAAPRRKTKPQAPTR